MERRTGMKFVCELPGEGWQLALYKDKIIAAHPDHPPRMIHADGTVEEFKVVALPPGFWDDRVSAPPAPRGTPPPSD
jgi:hypothetical protein